MSFGHHAINIGGAHIDIWGAGPFLIRSGKRSWYFEDSDMFGPVILRKSDMQPHDQQPGDRDPFWTFYNRWRNAGRKSRALRTRGGRLRFYLCHLSRQEVLR
jgi:hypothetical protein